MPNRKAPPKKPNLRRQADARLRQSKVAQGAPVATLDVKHLVHEFEVHQVELEMQNEELRSSRLQVEAGLQRYAELFDFAPIGYVTVSPAGSIQEINLAAASLFGLGRASLKGRSLFDLVPLGQRAALVGFLNSVLETPDGEGGGTWDLRLEGEGVKERHLLLTAAALKGECVSVLMAMEDVTARRQAEESLREESRRKDEFMAMLSHELRNPLLPLRTGLAVLERANPESDRAKKAHEVIHRQLEHLTRIVDDLLDLTRLKRDKVRLKLERLELGELVLRTSEDYRSGFETAGVTLHVQPFPGPLWVDGDATRLIQVFGNLFGNAVKFTPVGGRVDVVAGIEGGRAVVRVRDNGVGIAPALREHLFEPFIQGPQSLARTRGGLGLGLAMVKRFVELHHGEVAAVSAGLENGTEFVVRLPLKDGLAPRPLAPARAQGPRCRVLIIEDNVDSADLLQDLLASSGHTVEVAHDGPTALTIATRFLPDVVLCDIGLPGMDGYEVAQALRAQKPARPPHLVALTGYALPSDHRHALDAGFDVHVAKPPSVETLEGLLAEIAQKRCERQPGPLH